MKDCKNRTTYFAVVKMPEDAQLLEDEDEEPQGCKPIDWTRLPPELGEYRQVFDDSKAKILPLNSSTDHTIETIKGYTLLVGPLYPLLRKELKTLY